MKRDTNYSHLLVNPSATPNPKGTGTGRPGLDRRALENAEGRRCTAQEFREATELGITVQELREQSL